MPNSASDGYKCYTLHVANHCRAVWREAFAFSKIALALENRLPLFLEPYLWIPVDEVLAELELMQSYANDNPA